MHKKIGVLVVACSILTFPQPTFAQQTDKVWRTGTLMSGSPATHGRYLKWYRQGLRDLGYMEGRNYVFISRWAKGKPKRLPGLARDLVKAKIDLFLVNGGAPIRAAAKVSKTIPIVVGSASDLGYMGLVASLSKPGGNITGSTAIGPDLSQKRLELLLKVVNGARRVAFLYQHLPNPLEELKLTKAAARKLGVTIQAFSVENLAEIENAFRSMKKQRPDALILTSSIIIFYRRKEIAKLVREAKLPTVCARQRLKNTGCLLAYAPDREVMFRRAAIFVDKIFKGAKPGDLPIERPAKFLLIVNLKLAKEIGFTVPTEMLLRAHKVIE